MKYILALLLFISCSKDNIERLTEEFTPVEEKGFVKIDVKEVYSAVGNGIADDWLPIQRALDSAAKIGAKVYLPRGKYKISKPLMIYHYTNKYEHCMVDFYGDDQMWSFGTMVTVIQPTFKDGFALGIQQGKGVTVRGIAFQGLYRAPRISMDSMYRTRLDEYGDTSVRRDKFSPYSAIVVDPFGATPPPGGGYPTMQEWYRGPAVNSGSTGCRFEDLTFLGFDVGAVTSPNGITRNAEILTFQNIRVTDCRIGFGTSQEQEKMNRIINVGAWGVTHTLFAFGRFGWGGPGHWIIDGVNVAGQVANLVDRTSSGFFPLYVNNVFAEQLGSLGKWTSDVGDVLSNSNIDFVYPDQVKAFHFSADPLIGVKFQNCNIRVYGDGNTPMVFGSARRLLFDNLVTYLPPVWGYVPTNGLDSLDMGGYKLYKIQRWNPPIWGREGSNITATLAQNIFPGIRVGDRVIMTRADNQVMGMGRVARVDGSVTVDYIPNKYDRSQMTYFYVYRKK